MLFGVRLTPGTWHEELRLTSRKSQSLPRVLPNLAITRQCHRLKLLIRFHCLSPDKSHPPRAAVLFNILRPCAHAIAEINHQDCAINRWVSEVLPPTWVCGVATFRSLP